MFGTFLLAVAGAAAAQVDQLAYNGRPVDLADVGHIAAGRAATGFRLLGGPDDTYGRSEAAFWGGYAGQAAALAFDEATHVLLSAGTGGGKSGSIPPERGDVGRTPGGSR